jgi:hypothetical protein
MISKTTRKRWQDRVDFLENDGWSECSNWELSFIDSVSTALEQGRDLTFKQSSKLGDIFHRVERKLG